MCIRDSDDSAMSGYFNRIFEDYLYGSSSPLLRDIPIQSAIVWNNGVPTYLMDQHNPGKQSRDVYKRQGLRSGVTRCGS